MKNTKTILYTILIIFLQYCIADLGCAYDEIINLLHDSKEATVLKFNYHELTEEDTALISNFLSTNAYIEILDLSQNYIKMHQWNCILTSLNSELMSNVVYGA